MSVILSLQLLASDPVTRITGIDAIVTTDVAVPWFECLHTVWHYKEGWTKRHTICGTHSCSCVLKKPRNRRGRIGATWRIRLIDLRDEDSAYHCHSVLTEISFFWVDVRKTGCDVNTFSGCVWHNPLLMSVPSNTSRDTVTVTKFCSISTPVIMSCYTHKMAIVSWP